MYFTLLLHYGTKYTADTELVKDSIQELFIGIWKRRNFLSTEVNPKPYLIASLRRILNRKLQGADKLVQYKADAISDRFDFQISVEQKIIDKESSQQLTDLMAEKLSKLPKRQKEVIHLKFFQNLNRDEIAKLLGNHPQTVSNLLQMALKKLRLEFEGIIWLHLFIFNAAQQKRHLTFGTASLNKDYLFLFYPKQHRLSHETFT